MEPLWMNDHLKSVLNQRSHQHWKLGLDPEEVTLEIRKCDTKVKIIPVDLSLTLLNKTKGFFFKNWTLNTMKTTEN